MVQIFDPQEADPRPAGDVELVDVETGAARQVTITERHGGPLSRAVRAEFHDGLREYCGRRGIPIVRIASTMPEDEILRRVIVGR